MPEYMRALHAQFDIKPPTANMLEDEMDQVLKKLRERMEKPERKLLLRLVDLSDTLRNETSLYSFIAGYKLACGIVQELNEQPGYSFTREEERRACQMIRAQQAENGGE